MKSYEDAEALASQIRSGALKLELEELQSEVVGAKLGSQAIKTSIIAAIIGLLIIIAFMLIAYRIPGLAASIALLIYTGIVLAILHLYHITLTAGYRWYYPVHRYGSGCKCYYLCTYP